MISRIPFGRTGHLSSRIIFGGFAVGFMPQAEANETLDLLLEHGINHIDTAPTYGDSELRIGSWLPPHRDRFFLATKTEERTYDSAYAEIQRSLERLQTDHIDLIQFHNLVDPGEWAEALGENGALAAAQTAQRKGYVRHIGVTGHGLSVAARHYQSLDRFPLDSVLLPFNFTIMQNEAYTADLEALLARCRQEHVAVQTIKGIARGRWGEQKPRWNTWYEPLADQADIDDAVHYVLHRPDLFLNTAGDPVLFKRIVAAAERFDEGQLLTELDDRLHALALQPLFSNGDDF